MKKWNRILKYVIILCLIIIMGNIPAKIGKAYSMEPEYLSLSVGKKYVVYDYIDMSKIQIVAPEGKYTISDTRIVGMESIYNKKKDSWHDCIVALRPGKAVVTEWNKNKIVNIFKITVTRRALDSISSYFGSEKAGNYKPKETDNAAKKMLKSIGFDQYNSDRTRIAALTNYLYKNVKYGSNKYDQLSYGTLVKHESVCAGHANAMKLLFQNLGYVENVETSIEYEHAWNTITLENTKYIYDLVDVTTGSLGDFLYGSKLYHYTYAGEGTYVDEYGNTQPGSLYYDEFGDLDESMLDSYRNDIYNELLRTHGSFGCEVTQKKNLFYLSDKKSHLPAWLTGLDTDQQKLLKGGTIELPKDRMSSNVFSSDESIVKVVGNSIVGVNPGIAIVYRYDASYCDAFYVLVDPAGTKKATEKKKKLQFKADGKKHQTYKTSDICPSRRVLELKHSLREDLWLETVCYKLEPVFLGGKLVTTYDNGLLKAYMIDKDGNKKLLFDDKNKLKKSY